MKDLETIKAALREYVVEFITYGDPIDDDESLIKSGLTDSTGAMEMLLFVEETFEVEVDDAEMDPDNFDSINICANFVLKKLGG